MTTEASGVAEVAVFAPAPGTYSYSIPRGMEVAVGARVWVRFGGRGAEGIVVALPREAPSRALKPIAAQLQAPSPGSELVALGQWVAEYYLAPPGEAMRLLVPSGGRAREARRVQLTEAGRRAAEGLGRALEPPELDGLALRERVVLERLLAAGGEERVKALSDLDGAKIALGQLVEGGLARWLEAVRARAERIVEEVVPGRAPEADEPVLRGAPRRRALFEQVQTAARPPTVAELRALDPRAAEHLRALAAAGLVALRRCEDPDRFTAAAVARDQPPVLNDDQRAVLERIAPALAGRAYAPFLIHGVTGSGKTEVYLHAIARALALGRGALVLVPEISLTPQLAGRFRARFGDQVAVLHSGLGDRARFDAWVRLRDGRVRIALGARSAVFAPVADLGVVVVDEEHDPSFKQEEGVRYHGRDVALKRARAAGAVVLLGSATPSVETYQAALDGRLGLCSMPRRATPRPLPVVELIDLRQHKLPPPGEVGGLLAAPLARAIEETLAAREQVILFLNRRGFATFVLCKACGHRFTCKHCAVTLTYHRGADRLACHYCGYLEPAPGRCPRCQAQAVVRLGTGTERVEELVAARFPGARVARLDRDAARGAGLERVLDGLRDGTIDLVVGTQMVTKGHDFPGVTLVGVVLADHAMGMPDFRASERTFQLLEQVAGRAGRGERPGRVLIQTYNPNHPAVQRAVDHDYPRFFAEERAAREEVGYPPFVRLAAVRVDGADGLAVRTTAEEIAARARAVAAQAPEEARIAFSGPSEAPLARLKGRARWHLLVKAANARALRTVVRAAVEGKPPRGVRVVVDIDPVSMM